MVKSAALAGGNRPRRYFEASDRTLTVFLRYVPCADRTACTGKVYCIFTRALSIDTVDHASRGFLFFLQRPQHGCEVSGSVRSDRRSASRMCASIQ